MSRAIPTASPFDTSRAEGSITRPSPIALLIGLGVLSRVLIFEVGALAFRFLPHAWVQNVPGYFAPAAGYWSQSLLGVWAHWDGYWYLSIATLGYEGRSISTAFFPLYPLLVRALGGTAVSGIIVSLLCFAGGAWLLFLLARRELGHAAAWYGVLALMFFPSSFYFNAVYPEALVVLLSAASLYLLSLRHYGWAALIAGIASAASVDGLLLGVPLLVSLWQERRPWREWLSLLLVPLGLASYMGYLLVRFGNPLTFQAAQAHWGRSFAPPWITLIQGIADFFRNIAQFNWPHLFAGGEPAVAMSNVWNLLFAIVGIALVVLAARKLRPALWSYALAVLIVPLFYPSTGVPLMSAPRFLLSAWPIFLAAGAILAERPRWIRPFLWLSILIGAFFVALFATAHWVA